MNFHNTSRLQLSTHDGIYWRLVYLLGDVDPPRERPISSAELIYEMMEAQRKLLSTSKIMYNNTIVPLQLLITHYGASTTSWFK